MKVPEVPFLEAVQDVSAGNTKIPQSAFLDAGSLAVVDQGQSLIAGYTNALDATVKTASPVIVFGDHTRALKFVDFPFAMGADGVKVLLVSDVFDPKFVYRFLESRPIPSAGYSRHFKFLKEIQIPKPPLAEQRRIAAVLDHADALRAKRRQVLTHLDTLTQSIFHDMFGSVAAAESLRHMGVDFASGKNVLGGGLDSHSINRVIKVSAISRGHFIPSESKPMPAGYVPPLTHKLSQGDILFGRASGSLDLLGATAVVNVEPENLFLPDKVWRLAIKPGAKVEAGYILGVLRSPGARSFIRHNASGAAGVRNIGKAKLLEYVGPLPSLELQRVFARRVAETEMQRASVARAQAADDELFTSLQSGAFRREL